MLMATKYVLLLFIFIVGTGCRREDRGLVVGKIHEASDLATTEFTIDKIVHGTKTRKLSWFIKLGEARFLAYSKAFVKAGIDLKSLKEEDIRIEEKKISLKLPAVKIVNFSYPFESFAQDSFITDTRSLFVNINIQDQEAFFRQAELDIRNNLQYMGIVRTTQENTRKILSRLLEALGYEEIYITFENNDLLIEKVDPNAEEDKTKDR